MFAQAWQRSVHVSNRWHLRAGPPTQGFSNHRVFRRHLWPATAPAFRRRIQSIDASKIEVTPGVSLVLAAPQHADNGSVKSGCGDHGLVTSGPPQGAGLLGVAHRSWKQSLSRFEKRRSTPLVRAPHVEHLRSATGTEPVPT
jgi:hypothetical protein